MCCQVVNKYKVNMSDPDIVYIGRGSIWGNPHEMIAVPKGNKDQERHRVIAAYKQTLWRLITSGKITKEMLIALDGKRLACYCAPKSCHGDIIARAVRWAKQ
ncbi:hypothetical protein phiK7A1_099 [Pseudomonas phage phiK7A1]|uniref:DUF4326 domain-containing protein n=1 Tax=Pseudomonas phage phiK7A1 TaxID=2759194 RepID=A0A7H0XFU7_9CAUD|nr:hypothetical protein phiK7A1_099 [Pseudomonas phage phiK7A1]